MTLKEFLEMNRIPKITVQKGKGRMFADIHLAGTGSQRLFFSEECDLKKPLFVHSGAHDALWVGNNQGVQVVMEIAA